MDAGITVRERYIDIIYIYKLMYIHAEAQVFHRPPPGWCCGGAVIHEGRASHCRWGNIGECTCFPTPSVNKGTRKEGEE